jgi:hypothetical protein
LKEELKSKIQTEFSNLYCFHRASCIYRKSRPTYAQSQLVLVFDEFSNLTQAISALRDETEIKLERVTTHVQSVSHSINERTTVHIVDTRNKTESISREVEARTKALTVEIHEHTTETDCSLDVMKQEVANIRKEMSTEREKLQFKAGEKIKMCNDNIKAVEVKIVELNDKMHSEISNLEGPDCRRQYNK